MNLNSVMMRRCSAFPRSRLYRHGRPVHEGTYRGDRTVVAMAEFMASKLELQAVYEHYPLSRKRGETTGMMMIRHCRIAGHVPVNRVPGNFHITAHQSQESQNAKRTNISHITHRLAFGEPLDRWQRRKLGYLADQHANSGARPDAAFRGAHHRGVHQSRPVWKSNLRRVPSSTPSTRRLLDGRGDAGSSPLDRARTAASSCARRTG